MSILQLLKTSVLRLDGGMGTLLQDAGLAPGEYPEVWNLTHPQTVCDIHKAYFDAGSHIVCANTFGANCLKFSEPELSHIIEAAVSNARRAQSESTAPQEKFVALDIGPTGRLLKPYGDLSFEDAVSIFAQTIRLGVLYGVDLILIETMNDSYETKAAVLAAKENAGLPVFVSNAYGEDGKLMTGASPAAMAAMLEGMRVDAIGANCSLGPKQLRGVIRELLRCASVPVLLKPNAGLPRSEAGKTVYDVSPEEFAGEVAELVGEGVRIAGGCCGTTPQYIACLTRKIQDAAPQPVREKEIACVSSYTHCVELGASPVLIGERINPTGKKRFKQALREKDIAYLLQEGLRQQERGVHILDVNVGLPEIDEPALLQETVCQLQAVIDLPLQIDTSDIRAMEAALRCYNGKAMINSVNGKEESMRAVFPLVQKYGGLVVALTLDENGIPATAQGRVEIAEKIIRTAAEYGIFKKDLVFDTLAMTISADAGAAQVTLQALREIRQRLGCHTSLGISNVSFGLPNRDAINSVFFTAAMENGLSAAILNPDSVPMRNAYFAFRALHGLDENCADYIANSQAYAPAAAKTPPAAKAAALQDEGSSLRQAIIRGLKEQAAAETRLLLERAAPLDIVNGEIIPALDSVGYGFEKKTVYLPQLLMSAEAANAAFSRIKAHLSADGHAPAVKKCPFVLATVQGDIHDIGKNIVKLLLENYGFAVTDLGKDVPPEAIAEAVVRLHAPLAGLSALMTTTVPAMEETIRRLRTDAPWCKIVVGGAVLTQEYADRIGADKYARDAMETVRYADQIFTARKA